MYGRISQQARTTMSGTDDHPLFISYDREDSGGWSLYLYERLRLHFGEDAVFRDTKSIPTGEHWKPLFARKVQACRALVLVIGPDWHGARVQEKLRDPKGYVRNEILTALAHGRRILPVLVGQHEKPINQLAADLPEEIRGAVGDSNAFVFHDTRTSDAELETLFSDIERYTHLPRSRRRSQAGLQRWDRALALLDRNPQASELKDGFHARCGRLFFATGAPGGGFYHFAIRGLLELLGAEYDSSSGGGERVVALNWERFSEPDERDERELELLLDIHRKLLTEPGRPDPARLSEHISRAVADTRRPTVIYSTAVAGSRFDASRAREWFSTWKALLGQDPSPRVIVILFIEHDWWRLPPRSVSRGAACDLALRSDFGRVSWRDVRSWLEGEVRNNVEGDLFNKINREARRAFRWRLGLGREFDDISEAIVDVWRTAPG